MSRKVVAVAVALVLAFSSGCTISRTGNSQDPSADEWVTRIDPVTGTELRCLVIWRSSPHKGGPAMWCVEP